MRPIQRPDDACCVNGGAGAGYGGQTSTGSTPVGRFRRLTITSDGFTCIGCSAYPSLKKVAKVLRKLLGEGVRPEYVSLGEADWPPEDS